MSSLALEPILRHLPPVEKIERRSEADYYGASHLIAAKLGLAAPPRSIASWKHGIIYESGLRSPQLLLSEGNRATRHLVTNQWQADQLREAGYWRVHATGVPFLYAERLADERLRGSLLIMPAHSLSKSTHAFDEAGYVARLAGIRERFSVVAACVNATCVRRGMWIHALERAGIPWLVGADSHDRNALVRMRTLFSLFEFMTTNALGSHVAYAAYSGCKVSLWGPLAQYRLEDFKGISWYRKHWDRVEEFIAINSEAHIRSRHPQLFREPWEAEDLRAWSEPFVGHRHRRSVAELAQLLGWTAVGRAEGLAHRAGAALLKPFRRRARRRIERDARVGAS